MKSTLRTLAVIVSCVVGLSACGCAVSPPPVRSIPKTKCSNVNAAVRADVRGDWPDSDITMRVCANGWAWVVGDQGMNATVRTTNYRVEGNRWVKQFSWARLFEYCTPNPSITGSAKFQAALKKEAPPCKSHQYIA